MQLNPNDVHVWSIDLMTQPEQEKELLALLNPDEIARAERFRVALPRQRFITARGTLRRILSLYLNMPPQNITLAYNEYKKPYLLPLNLSLQFNLAHSHDKAVYALGLHHAIGIDIEKIRQTYNTAIAKRYFSPKENAALINLSKNEAKMGFYRLWSRKEALVKAIGKGLSFPFAAFSVAASDVSETIVLEDKIWTLLPLFIHPEYACALATHQIVKTVSYWHLTGNGHKIIKQSNY
jgi:4'-phosphopantetheinyl transferase